MTRNTKLYKFKSSGKEDIIYRDLTVEELNILKNIKNDAVKTEKAADYAVISGDPSWPIKIEIGAIIIEKSNKCISDDELFEINVEEFRDKIKKDFFLSSCRQILSIMPSMNFTELNKMTNLDIIELLCLCESMTDKKLINTSKDALLKPKKQKMSLINTSELSPQDADALKQQIRNLNG